MKKSIIIAVLFCLTFSPIIFAQNQFEINLWPDGMPESNGLTGPEIVENERISNVTDPTMTIYPADPTKNTGAAILICPGGGYIRLAAEHEGRQFGKWLSENGITGFVLKYRMPNHHSFIPLKDAQQALRIIRSKAAEWHINPGKIGISGFSAGGHLASTAGTHFDLGKPATKTNQVSTNKKTGRTDLSTISCRPDFMILFYPVISMQENITHSGSRLNLLGENCSKDSVLFYSNELHVTKDTPPTLLFLSDDDQAVLPNNSTAFYDALKKNNIPASIHIFPEGGHGWGFHDTFRYHETWKALYIDWLKQQKMIE
ncbi:MAG: alpha/beta hydrolase [Bacteroidales bacterium]|nr:alpha/beta hydrolase [Bacteroidales bacterium]MDD3908055.1 alpha/beta hydrolase [Bacteroidales bacterium]MDD4713119.1 alpha/beta hydrolase [Bacteroidales bacterium]